jgi:rSAM/selenodomain-associated transferase 1
MAKYPEPGRVKTRLGALIGAEPACRLYRAFLHDLAARLAGLSYPVTWAYAPPESPFPSLLPSAHCRPQQGGDLGERMAAAIAEEFRDGAGAVVVIGVDAPHLPSAFLAEAAEALASGADVVLGPAADGGYYLVGVVAPVPGLFRSIPWSTAGVFAATVVAAERLRLRLHRLPPTFDVDEPADLDRLREVLARDGAFLPETARVLADIALPA